MIALGRIYLLATIAFLVSADRRYGGDGLQRLRPLHLADRAVSAVVRACWRKTARFCRRPATASLSPRDLGDRDHARDARSLWRSSAGNSVGDPCSGPAAAADRHSLAHHRHGDAGLLLLDGYRPGSPRHDDRACRARHPLCRVDRRHRPADAARRSRGSRHEPRLDARPCLLRDHLAAAAAEHHRCARSSPSRCHSTSSSSPTSWRRPVSARCPSRSTPRSARASRPRSMRYPRSSSAYRARSSSSSCNCPISEESLIGVEVASIGKVYGQVRVLDQVSASFQARPAHQPARSVGLGQDDTAAHHRRLRCAR